MLSVSGGGLRAHDLPLRQSRAATFSGVLSRPTRHHLGLTHRVDKESAAYSELASGAGTVAPLCPTALAEATILRLGSTIRALGSRF